MQKIDLSLGWSVLDQLAEEQGVDPELLVDELAERLEAYAIEEVARASRGREGPAPLGLLQAESVAPPVEAQVSVATSTLRWQDLKSTIKELSHPAARPILSAYPMRYRQAGWAALSRLAQELPKVHTRLAMAEAAKPPKRHPGRRAARRRRRRRRS